MPRVKALGNRDMKAIAEAKRAMKSMPETEQRLIRQLNALKELTGKASDAEFAEMLGLSDGRYRYLKRHPSQIKLGEICLVRRLAEQYGFRVDFDIEEAAHE
ncbi:MAG: hypothetical protein ACI4MM_05100 [Candidatus Ventricola sp.]